MQPYIGRTIVQAEPMDEEMFIREHRGCQAAINSAIPRAEPGTPGAPGYLVCHAMGWRSWEPKEAFEAAYRAFTRDELKLIYGPHER